MSQFRVYDEKRHISSFSKRLGTAATDKASEFISRLLRAGIELLGELKNATLLINGGSSYTKRMALFVYLGE